MTLSPSDKQELDRFGDMIRSLGKSSHHTLQEYPKAVELFIRLYERGEGPHSDAVKDWALDRGWTPESARDLGEMADTVAHVLRALREQGRI